MLLQIMLLPLCMYAFCQAFTSSLLPMLCRAFAALDGATMVQWTLRCLCLTSCLSAMLLLFPVPRRVFAVLDGATFSS
jgi:hypothetical protein